MSAVARNRPVVALLLLAATAVLVLSLVPLVDGVPLLSFTADDAYISFRYSHNLAAGHGPVWNVGGPRTDGYTSPLWMLLIGLADLLGIGNEGASKALSLLAALGIVAILAFAVRRALLVRCLAIAVLALSPAFVAITDQGFETTTAAFLATATGLLTAVSIRSPGRRQTLALAVTGMLAAFARPDLLPFVLCCFAGLGLYLARERRYADLRSAALSLAIGFALPGIAWAVWHSAYYGYALPNTSSVKRSQGFFNQESWDLIKGFVTRVAGPVLVMLAVLLGRAVRRRDAVMWAVGPMLAGAFAFLAVGLKFEPIQGDMWRFQMPILGVLLLCLVLVADSDPLFSRLSGVPAIAAALVVVAIGFNTLGTVQTEIRGRWVYDRKEAGLALDPFKGDGLSMFVSESGALPWASGWKAWDLIGLNDRYIAQHGASVAHVTALNPDLLQFIVSIEPGAQFSGHYRPFADLVQTGRYEFATATLKTNDHLRAGVPASGHLFFVRSHAPHAGEVLATLRGLTNVRTVPPEIVVRALAGLGYRPPR